MNQIKAAPKPASQTAQPRVKANSHDQRMVMQYGIARILAEASSIQHAAAPVLKIICEAAGWEFGALWRVESETHTLINDGVWYADTAAFSEYAEKIRHSFLNENDTSLPAHVLENSQALWLSNLGDIPTPDATAAVKAGLNSAFILPVRSNGKLIAILECLTHGVQSQNKDMVKMLTTVADQIGIFMERKVVEDMFARRASQQHLLAEIGIALSTSLDIKAQLNNIMHVMVPDLTDWCAIDLIDENNHITRVAAAHVDPEKEKLVYAILSTHSVEITPEFQLQLESLRCGGSMLTEDISPFLLETTIANPEMLEITRQLGPRSSIVVPLIARERILGICTFVQSDVSKRRFVSNDLSLAEDIGRRVALGLDNAIMYARTKQTNAELEQRVQERTAQLQGVITLLTNQITERQAAEDKVRLLNWDLEKRITERTSELETTNQTLSKAAIEQQQTSQSLRKLLRRTRELYRISQKIGTFRLPNEVIGVLLSNSYLKDVNRASIAIFDKNWQKNQPPPEYCTILAEWNKSNERPTFINRRFTMLEYGVVLPVPYAKPIVIKHIKLQKGYSEVILKRFIDLGSIGVIILPLIAVGEFYGLLSLHFTKPPMPTLDDLRYLRGLVDQTAMAIKNIRLLEAESQARHEAEAANTLKLNFLAMISHELRTPLASIKGFATTLLADDVVWPAETQKDFLETISVESDKLSDLIEQLLDLSRIEAGVLRITPKKQSLNSIITPALAQMHAVLGDHELAIEMEPNLPPILGDEQRIAQVLTNLVGNAAKYSPAKTQITLSTHVTNDMIQVDVEDQGIGIPPRDRIHVFEAFHQLENKSSSHMSGAGLGLAICRGLIKAQGGTIWIQDRPGPGSLFSFTLPIAK